MINPVRIKIKKTPNADSRTAGTNISKEELIRSTESHMQDVRMGMMFFAHKLGEAAAKHDWSKLEYMDEFYRDFSAGLTGDAFKKAGWFEKHLQERHHLNDRCPEDVTLLDVLERVVDIVMAGMARSGSVYPDMLDAEILQRAYANTITLLKDVVVVVDAEAPATT